MVDLPRLVSEHFGSCHFGKKKGKERKRLELIYRRMATCLSALLCLNWKEREKKKVEC